MTDLSLRPSDLTLLSHSAKGGNSGLAAGGLAPPPSSSSRALTVGVAGQSFGLSPGVAYTIGSSKQANIEVGDSSLAPLHARLRDDELTLLHAPGLLNGQQMRQGVPVLVRPGDVLQLGNVRIELQAPTHATAPTQSQVQPPVQAFSKTEQQLQPSVADEARAEGLLGGGLLNSGAGANAVHEDPASVGIRRGSPSNSSFLSQHVVQEKEDVFPVTSVVPGHQVQHTDKGLVGPLGPTHTQGKIIGVPGAVGVALPPTHGAGVQQPLGQGAPMGLGQHGSAPGRVFDDDAPQQPIAIIPAGGGVSDVPNTVQQQTVPQQQAGVTGSGSYPVSDESAVPQVASVQQVSAVPQASLAPRPMPPIGDINAPAFTNSQLSSITRDMLDFKGLRLADGADRSLSSLLLMLPQSLRRRMDSSHIKYWLRFAELERANPNGVSHPGTLMPSLPTQAANSASVLDGERGSLGQLDLAYGLLSLLTQEGELNFSPSLSRANSLSGGVGAADGLQHASSNSRQLSDSDLSSLMGDMLDLAGLPVEGGESSLDRWLPRILSHLSPQARGAFGSSHLKQWIQRAQERRLEAQRLPAGSSSGSGGVSSALTEFDLVAALIGLQGHGANRSRV